MWYKKYGWNENPFSIKPVFDKLVGAAEKRKKLLDFVHAGNICFLNGPAGVGKSSTLKWLQYNLKGYTPIYIDSEHLEDDFDLAEYMKGYRTFWEVIMGHEYPKSAVILLDEAHATEKKMKRALKLYWDHDYIKSIVITQIPDLKNFDSSVRNRIGDRVIKLDKMEKKLVHDMINHRANDNHPFTKEAVELIAKKSKHIPRKILENCERVCIDMKGKSKVDASDVRKALK
ncbi:MAG: ATP-binding protein [Nanoarchaeota archaeon]|nr:ATP-binding protein [Nanoarchaeota archaeon]MCG2719523.1 ATP-binding protein [Nanoarchaeota archaeon]